MTTRRVDRLADGLGHFVRLARGDTDFPLPVANGHERIEGEPPASLDHLRDAIDRDDVLDEVAAFALAAWATAAIAATTAAVASSATIAAATATTTASGATRPARPAATATAPTATSAASAAGAAASAGSTTRAATTAAAALRLGRLPAAFAAALLILSHVRTPVRPRGRHRPLPSRGRDIGILRGRRRPS